MESAYEILVYGTLVAGVVRKSCLRRAERLKGVIVSKLKNPDDFHFGNISDLNFQYEFFECLIVFL